MNCAHILNMWTRRCQFSFAHTIGATNVIYCYQSPFNIVDATPIYILGQCDRRSPQCEQAWAHCTSWWHPPLRLLCRAVLKWLWAKVEECPWRDWAHFHLEGFVRQWPDDYLVFTFHTDILCMFGQPKNPSNCVFLWSYWRPQNVPQGGHSHPYWFKNAASFTRSAQSTSRWREAGALHG